MRLMNTWDKGITLDRCCCPEGSCTAADTKLSFAAEAARASGQVATATGGDPIEYSEQMEMKKVAANAITFGEPEVIIVSMAHVYSGPRRVRVGTAMSRPTFLRRSVLARRTFAMVAVRLIVAEPIDRFLKVARDEYSS